jgi:phenylalanyl-tRNA synthetase beta chain
MRTTLLPGVLRVLRHNLNHGQENVRLMQLDRVFLNTPGPLAGLPTESERLLIALCGNQRPSTWGEEARASDLYDFKGLVAGFLRDLGVDTVWTWGYTERFLEEATSFVISTGYGDSPDRVGGPARASSQVLGGGGRLLDVVQRDFQLDVPVYVVDFDVAALQRAFPGRPMFRELPRFPAVKRDLSLVVPAPVTYGEVERVVRQATGALLESVACFDLFQGSQAAKNTESRSLGLRLRFRSPDRTLTDEMVDPQIQEILHELAGSLHVVLRAT